MAEVRLTIPGVSPERLSVPSRQVRLLRTRQLIRPVAPAGILRLYDPRVLTRLSDELSKRRASRGQR